MTKITEFLSQEIETQLKEAGRALGEDKEKLQAFLLEIEPHITRAINSGDMKSVTYLKAIIKARLGRVSLGILHRERERVISGIATVIRTLITFVATA